jgi:tRNA-guanine family transglycosylase
MKIFLSWYTNPPDPPYWLWIRDLDGLLVSLHSLRGGILDAAALKGLKRYIGFSKTLIVDSLPHSLFNNPDAYVNSLQSLVLYAQRILGADILVHRDIPLVRVYENRKEELLKRTMLNAEHALKMAERLGVDVMLVVQGWDPESYARCADYYRGLGVRYAAIGSLVPRRQNPRFVGMIVKLVREVLGKNVYIHLLGVANPRIAVALARYIDSVDISTPIKAAVVREMLVEVNGMLKRVHLSTLGEEQLYKLLKNANKDLAEGLMKAKRMRDVIRLIALYNAHTLISWIKKNT